MPKRPAIDDMLMMQPASDFFRCGMASRVVSNMPVRLIAITLSQSSGGNLLDRHASGRQCRHC